jgi:hypothetical protein
MSKKDLASVTADLSALAQMMPTQRPAVSEPPALRVVPPVEEVIQFSLSLRKGLRKQLARLADEADMTMRAFVLDASPGQGPRRPARRSHGFAQRAALNPQGNGAIPGTASLLLRPCGQHNRDGLGVKRPSALVDAALRGQRRRDRPQR